MRFGSTLQAWASGLASVPHLNAVSDNWDFLSLSVPNLYPPEPALIILVILSSSSSKISLQWLQLYNLLLSQVPFCLLPSCWICEAHCSRGPLGWILGFGSLEAWLAGPQCQCSSDFDLLLYCAHASHLVLPAGPNFLPAPAAGQMQPVSPTIPFGSSQGHLLIDLPGGRFGRKWLVQEVKDPMFTPAMSTPSQNKGSFMFHTAQCSFVCCSRFILFLPCWLENEVNKFLHEVINVYK